MRFRFSFTICGALAQLTAVLPVHALEIACRDHQGRIVAVDLPGELPFEMAMADIESQLASKPEASEYLIDFMVAQAPAKAAVRTKGVSRNYKDTLSEQDKRQVDYIVSTLGNASLLSIAKARSDLKRSGAQIEKIHPFRFLTYVFSNEKLRAALQNMTKRSWVWKEYFEGIKRSLEEESANGNMLGHVKSFAASLSLDEDALYVLVRDKKWKEFMQFLLQQRPRSGDCVRYDM